MRCETKSSRSPVRDRITFSPFLRCMAWVAVSRPSDWATRGSRDATSAYSVGVQLYLMQCWTGSKRKAQRILQRIMLFQTNLIRKSLMADHQTESKSQGEQLDRQKNCITQPQKFGPMNWNIILDWIRNPTKLLFSQFRRNRLGSTHENRSAQVPDLLPVLMDMILGGIYDQHGIFNWQKPNERSITFRILQ